MRSVFKGLNPVHRVCHIPIPEPIMQCCRPSYFFSDLPPTRGLTTYIIYYALVYSALLFFITHCTQQVTSQYLVLYHLGNPTAMIAFR